MLEGGRDTTGLNAEALSGLRKTCRDDREVVSFVTFRAKDPKKVKKNEKPAGTFGDRLPTIGAWCRPKPEPGRRQWTSPGRGPRKTWTHHRPGQLGRAFPALSF